MLLWDTEMTEQSPNQLNPSKDKFLLTTSLLTAMISMGTVVAQSIHIGMEIAHDRIPVFPIASLAFFIPAAGLQWGITLGKLSTRVVNPSSHQPLK